MLIDEIENGFHYSKLPALWTRLHAFCAEHDVQLFASTHSLECLRALSGAVTADPDDFALLRMTVADGQATVEKFGGDMIEAALEQRVEIR
ncbi:MAG: ATP-binding protein [Planctomycetes bacterium]|nr:ATP-binding protein [Planctomycetota bacterium]